MFISCKVNKFLCKNLIEFVKKGSEKWVYNYLSKYLDALRAGAYSIPVAILQV